MFNSGLIAGSGSIVGPGAFTNSGQLTLQGLLNLSIGGALSNSGNIDIPAGSVLALQSSPLANTGTIRLTGGNLSGPSQLNNQSGGTITGWGTIAAPLIASSGNIALSDGTLNISNAFTNAGVIQLGGLAATLAGGNITNTGTIQGFGSINNQISNTTGSIEAFGGTLILNSPTPSSGGFLAAATGTKLLFPQGLAINAGLMSLVGGTFDNNGKPISNTGQISGFGIFRSGGLTNNGAITFAGGATTVNGNVTNAATKKIEVRFAPAVFTGNFTNNGIFKSTGAQVTFAAPYIENGLFISDPAENFFQNALIGPAGAWSGGLGDRFILSGDLINNSIANQSWQTSSAELGFIGGGLHQYQSPASDRGNTTFTSYENNFAWGKLTLGANDSLALYGDAIYVGILDLKGGLSAITSITGDSYLYYDLRQPENAYLNAQSYPLAGGGMIVAVPEPGSLLMCLLAVAATAGRTRKNRF
jgi:hypothetical protein